MRKARWLATVAIVLNACDAETPEISLSVAETEPTPAAPSDEETERHVRQNISDCAAAKVAKYAGSPYAMLTLWKNSLTQLNDSFVTADPDWQGCASDSHYWPLSIPGIGPSAYLYQADLGLVFRPDLSPPPGTVPLVTYYGDETYGRGGDKRGYDLATVVANAPGVTGFNYGKKLRVEGYIYPSDWRVSGGGYTALIFHNGTPTNTGDAATRTAAVPAPTELGTDVVIGYLMDPATATFDRKGKCDSDADCGRSQHCFVTNSDPRFSDGTLGTCMRACNTNADCTDPAAPRCDIARQHCLDPLVRFDGPEATFRRSSGATFQVAADQMSWSEPNNLRWENLGEGYGAQPLLEGASSNYVLFSNKFDTSASAWSATTLVGVTETKSSPGPQPALRLTVAENWGNVFAKYGNASTAFASLASGYSLSLWRRTVRETGLARWNDTAAVMIGGAASVFAFDAPLIPGWSRTQLTFTTSSSGPVYFYIGESAPVVGDQREVAYLQAEPLQFATSAIPTNGAVGTRAADDLRVTTKNLNQSFRLIAFPEANAGTGAGIQTFITLLDAAGAELYRLQLEPLTYNTARIGYVKPTGTAYSTVSLSYLRNNPLIVDVDYTGTPTTVRLWGAGNSAGVSLVALALPTNVVSARIGARADGSQPFYGRISEPLPLGRGSDQVPARLVTTRFDPTVQNMSPMLYASYSEHIASGSAVVASPGRSRSITTGFGSVVNVPLGGLLDPGRMHTITMSATDVAGNTTSSSLELLAPGSAYPGPSAELVRLRADASSGTSGSVATWEDMSGRSNDALYVVSAGTTTRTTWGPALHKPAMLFRGASELDQLELRAINTANVQSADYTMFVVFARTTATGIQPLWSSANASLTVNANGTVEFKQGSSVLTSTATVAINTPGLAIVRVASSGVRELTINSLAPVSQTVAGTTTSLGGFLGRNQLATPNYLTGELGEFVIYTQWLADAERDTIRNHFKATYGIP